jgi:predicted ABC-class ATPase
VSSILVVGGAGDYLNVSDTVVQMMNYAASDATQDAKAVCAQFPSTLPAVAATSVDWKKVAGAGRRVRPGIMTPGAKCAARAVNKISYGDETELVLDGLEQLGCVLITHNLALSSR